MNRPEVDPGALARLARLTTTVADHKATLTRLQVALGPLKAGGLLAVQGEEELVSTLLVGVQQAEARIGELAAGTRPDPAAVLTDLERAVTDPMWQIATEVLADLPRREQQQLEIALDYQERLTAWQQRIEQVRRTSDEAAQVGAPCQEELAGLTVLTDLVQQVARAVATGTFAEAVLPLHRLDQGLPLPGLGDAPAGPDQLLASLRLKLERGRQLKRNVELLLLRTEQPAEHRSSYMVLLRNPLVSGAQSVILQGVSNVSDGDRVYLRDLIVTVTRKVNEGSLRRIRPAGEATTEPQPEPEAVDEDLTGIGDLLYKLVVPDSIQRLIDDQPATSLTIATNDLELPWELMASRVADGTPQHLGLQRPLARMPLGRALPRTGRPRPVNSTLRFLLVCSDPIGDLPQARAEVERIAAALRARPDGVEVVTRFDAEATGAMLNDALRGGEFDVLHYAGHAAFHDSDPDLSGLLLHNSEVFYAEKIQRLVEGQPLVFLNACQTGRAANENVDAFTTSYLGRPAGGLATAFLYGGALACIGSLWPVYDDAAAHFAITFYGQLLDGNLVGEAMRKARESTHKAFPGQVTWAAYSLNGDPTFRIATPSFAQPRRLRDG